MGFGPVAPEPDEPTFRAPWEKRALGLTLASGYMGAWNIDESRHARESLHPADYYLGQIETTAEGLKLLDGKNIQPGMPVEVVIKQGERSFLSYLFKPISDRMARSFKDY